MQRALKRLEKLDAPVLRYQAEFLLGRCQQASGDSLGAYESFQKAREALETLRSSLHGEELKIAFMKNRLEVYECLVELCLEERVRPNSAEESFGYMELAKSRSLAELLVQHAHASSDDDTGQSGLVRRIRGMREDLNWYYRRIENEQLNKEAPSRQRIEQLQKEALAHENELLRAFREVPAARTEFGPTIGSAIASLKSIRDCCPTHGDRRILHRKGPVCRRDSDGRNARNRSRYSRFAHGKSAPDASISRCRNFASAANIRRDSKSSCSAR